MDMDHRKKAIGNGYVIGLVVFSLLTTALISIAGSSGGQWWNNAAIGGTLENDNPGQFQVASFTADSAKFKVPCDSPQYTAVAIINNAAGEDYDLFVYDDYTTEVKIGESTLPNDVVDVVIIDGHTWGTGYKFAIVSQWSGGSNWDFHIESDSHMSPLHGLDAGTEGPLTVGTTSTGRFENGDLSNGDISPSNHPLVNMYDVYLYSGGSYTFTLTDTSGLGLEMYLYYGSGGKADYLTKDDSQAATLTFDYSPTVTGWYGLLVVDPNGNTGTYDLLVTSDFSLSTTPNSQLIAPGMTANYTVDIDSSGVVTPIDLSYDWVDGPGSNTVVSAPAGTTVSFADSPIVPAGVSTNTTTMSVTTDGTTPAGTYYIRVTATDTGGGGQTHQSWVKLVVSDQPDFIVDVDYTDIAISQGSQGEITIMISTINGFNGNVTLSATVNSGTTPNYINVSDISPNPVTEAGGYQATLIIRTNDGGTTPTGDYNILITGTNTTLGKSRSNNVSLHITNPVDIDIITPLNGDVISGTYLFSVGVTSATGISNVYMNLGGVLLPAGSIEAYYNSNTGYWERNVNTNAYSDGTATLNVTVIDTYGGRTQSATITFTVANTAPNPLVISPSDQEYVSGVIDIKANTSTNVVSAMYRIDTNAYQPLTGGPPTWSGQYDTTLSTDGSHTLTVWAKNSAGLIGTTTITIYIDNTPPGGLINSPLNNEYVQGTYTVRIIATDSVAVDHVDLTIFGTTVPVPYNPLTASYEYTFESITKPDGIYTMNATIYDMVGHSYNTPIRTFFIDNNAPTLLVTDVGDGTVLSANDFNLTVISEDEFLNKVEYRIDYTSWSQMTANGSDFYSLIDTTAFSDGAHTLAVRAIDNASHVTEVSYTVYI